jgi:hypothetical protein
MLQTLPHTVSKSLLEEAQRSIPTSKSRLILNSPTGNFFYDPWELKKEFKNTVWEKILSTLPIQFGEARIMVLEHGATYMSHTDIDDRYHLNLKGQYSYLIDIDSQEMFHTLQDSKWYEMDTGRRHVAANFGSYERVQLVVRKLLVNAELKDFKTITIKPTCVNPRFEFDDIISPWLNKINKQDWMSNFTVMDDGVRFHLDSSVVNKLDFIPEDKFKVIIQ